PLHSLPIIPKHPSLIPYHPQSSSTPWKHGWKKKTHRIEDSSPCSSFQHPTIILSNSLSVSKPSEGTPREYDSGQKSSIFVEGGFPPLQILATFPGILRFGLQRKQPLVEPR
ncbi:hypothetical protein LINPERPRIM_LOCUS35190, partial [Linum perenne]